jgi:hypothetical protein
MILSFPAPAQQMDEGAGSQSYFPTFFITVDAPSAGTGSLQGTIVKGIDTAGDVAGSYIDASGTSHGFVYSVTGTMTSFDVTGAGIGKSYGTFVTSVDAGGDVAGYYKGPSASGGFVRSANGTITSFSSATDGSAVGYIFGINSVGYVTGSDGWISGGDGYVRSGSGTSVSFAVPPGNPTLGTAINTAGAIAGRYMDNNYLSHGFVRSADGTTITEFDPPNVATTQTSHGNSGTIPTSIDTAGDVAGTYTDTTGERHSFLRAANGTITTFDPPGTYLTPCSSSGMGVIICGSGALGMNDAGQIVGAYIDEYGASHGFLRDASGNITAIDVSGAGSSSFQGTGVSAINAAGTIAGTYIDTNSVLHGFVGAPPPATTTTSLKASQSTSVFGEPASFTATISSSGGSVPNGETVYFSNGATQLGSSTLNGGTASFTTTGLPVGTDSITASYSGDADFAGSTSAAVGQSVGKATSSTTLTSSPNPSVSAQSVTLTATVSGQFGGTATGTVTFNNGSTSLGTASLSGNVAVLTTTALSPGTNSITAVYNGDANFAGSTSTAASQFVGKATSSTTLTSSPNPSVTAQSVTLTATVSGQFGGTATGTVTFNNGSTSLGTASLSSNVAVLTTAALPSGTESITAVYSGDSNFGTSSSNAVSEVVMDFSVADSPGSQTVTAGQNGTTSISVTPANGFNSTISFSCSGLPSGASCSFLPTTVTPSGGVASTTLTVTTTASMATAHRPGGPLFPMSTLAALVCCIGWKKRRLVRILPLIVVGAIGFTLLNGCGGNSAGASTNQQSNPQSQTWPITVNATSGSLQHTTSFSLTVN